MLRRLVRTCGLMVLAAMLLGGSSAAVVAQGQPGQPEAVLHKIYTLYDKNGTGLLGNKKLVQVYCTERLARLVASRG